MVGAKTRYSQIEKVALALVILVLQFKFQASNNEAKYEALIMGLRLAKTMDTQNVRVLGDSQVVVNQFNEDYQAKNE